MRIHLAVALLISFPAAAMPSASVSVTQSTGTIQTVSGPKLTLRQIASASKPSSGHKMLYTSKRALR